MAERAARSGRVDPRERTRRDIARRRRRELGGGLWSSLALIGSVGWPIVLLATGGALLGRYLDQRWGTGLHVTLFALTAGTVAGALIAYRTVRGGRP
jgi:predicted F0F1-ATPase subunit